MYREKLVFINYFKRHPHALQSLNDLQKLKDQAKEKDIKKSGIQRSIQLRGEAKQSD